MENVFYQNFIKNLYNNNFQNLFALDNVFFKEFENVLYVILPITNFENNFDVIQKFEEHEKFIQDNIYNLNVNKVVILRIFIFKEFDKELFRKLPDNFDIHNFILNVNWAVDLEKNKIFIKDGHISKIINLYEIINESFNMKEVLLSNKTNISTEKKPIFLTFSLTLVNIIIYIYINLFNKSNFNEIVKELAITPNLVQNHEFYRLITSIFLHLNFKHISSNCLSLYIFGVITEKFIDKWSFFICYFLGGAFGGLLSSIFNSGLSIGASGAIFSIEGALVYFYLKERKNLKNLKNLNLYQLIFIIIINIFIGFLNPQVDNTAHLGGFITGFIIMTISTWIKNLKNKSKIKM